jgi:hypothetical protein
MSMLVWLGIALCGFCQPDWGFFGHRSINRHAVYIMPEPVNQFFKKNIAWLEEHAVDPDKRRYAVPGEYKRHYIDLDFHDEGELRTLSMNLEEEVNRNLKYKIISEAGDTVELVRYTEDSFNIPSHDAQCNWPAYLIDSIVSLARENEPYEEIWYIAPINYNNWLNSCEEPTKWKWLIVEDHFSIHGILPYWLVIMQKRLTSAFIKKDISLILRLSADMGHYIGDAHVPLHTTKNYNGQLTNQHGIHGFWESRIPELFYEEWDLITGPATYIDDFQTYSWNIVRNSNSLVAEVLDMERKVRKQLPPDKIMCYEDRLSMNALTYCPEFARAYAASMQGMVDAQFRSSIQGVASSWYTAWIDAGQPVLWEEDLTEFVPVEAEPLILKSVPYGRPHDE